jgi:hypothetical protein
MSVVKREDAMSESTAGSGAISREVLARSIGGRNLRASTLGGELGRERTLLVFLRHLG